MDTATRSVLAARDGDTDAFADFVSLTQAEVWRFCAAVGDADAADDLTQDTYVRVVAALPGFRGESSARTWVLAIARRVCADHVRLQVRRRALFDRISPPVVGADPAGGVALWQLVEALEPAQREAFVLTQQLGCTYEEAATILDCAVGTIRSRVARARGQLIESLDADSGGHSASSSP